MNNPECKHCGCRATIHIETRDNVQVRKCNNCKFLGDYKLMSDSDKR
jgi:hypothetical protein